MPRAQSKPQQPATPKANAKAIPPLTQAILEQLTFGHGSLHFLLRTLKDPKTDLTWLPATQASPLHLGWVISHLTAYYRYVSMNLGDPGPTLPAWYRTLHPSMFDDLPHVQDTPAPNRISREALLRDHRRAWTHLLAVARATSPAQLKKPPAGSMHQYAPTKLACLHRCAWHEGWHTAQLAAIRRDRNMPLLFG
jgi:hypothetical protein